MRLRLRFEIAAALTAKAIALTVLYLLFFAPAHRPAISDAVAAQHLYVAPPQESAR
jgi:hypothetical protein